MAEHLMMTTTDGWACRHASLANPKGTRNDLPHLLRRTADLIEELGIKPRELMDVVIHEETTADGPSWSTTVYWSPKTKTKKKDPA
ncbi:hypothetical protein [Nocardioides montaniterrae]